MSRKLVKFVILFDNTHVLYFPGQFLTGRVIVELNDDTPALGKTPLSDVFALRKEKYSSTLFVM